ncbi:LOW QUALITY PROTEIN: bacitracin export permease protein BceB [Bacillus sp. JCM 19045]|nr:LOW QUALITY PROTEIN: bacitracin export permease protein BceB [Bacillus sp. JCM 19045]
MTFADIALKNIKRNVKRYGLYIGSTVFSIIVYFTFVTLRYNDEILAASENSRQLSSLVTASTFVLLIFVAIFIMYSNSFFIKKRKKEIALYALLGVRKRTIGWMLFIENMAIGSISLLIGIGLGSVHSCFFSLLMMLMGSAFTLTFTFSLDAVVHTILVFFVLFLLTSLQGYRVIYRFSLIDLFHAEKKGEAIPKARLLAALLGILTLATAYWMALQDLATSQVWRLFGIAMPLVVIALTVFGSYLLFRSVLVFLLHLLKRRKTWSWRGLNLLTISQLLYRIRANALTLTIISTLSATTITAGGAVFSTYYNVEKQVQSIAPFTFMWEGAEQEIHSEALSYQETFRSKTIRLMQNELEMEYTVIPAATFLDLADQLGWEEAEAPNEEQVVLIDAFYDERWSVERDVIELGNKRMEVADLHSEALLNVRTVGGTMLVMTDGAYDELNGQEKSYHVVQMNDYRDQLSLSQQLAASSDTNDFSSAVQDYNDSMEASGVMMFVGSFLGLVFLGAMGSIIYFKLMTEAEEDKESYGILHKVGVSQRDMSRSIRHQVGVIFMAPLLVGFLHASVALTAFSMLLGTNLLIPVLLWMAAYTFIYIVYYVITVRSFKKVIYSNQKGGSVR